MFPTPGSDLTTHPLPWQPEETLVYSALIMVTKTLSLGFCWWFFVVFFFKLQLSSFSLDLQHVASDKGWLTTRAKEQFLNRCWGTDTTFTSPCPSSSCQEYSLFPFCVWRPPLSSGELRGLWQITDLTWQVPAPDNNRQPPNKLGRRKAGKDKQCCSAVNTILTVKLSSSVKSFLNFPGIFWIGKTEEKKTGKLI